MEKENSGMERDDAGGQVREWIQGRVLSKREAGKCNRCGTQGQDQPSSG